MTYEEFKHLAEHPQHRDVPAIFKLEVLETEELRRRSVHIIRNIRWTPIVRKPHYNSGGGRDWCTRMSFTARRWRRKTTIRWIPFCYYISEIPMGLLHYDRECLSERMYDGRKTDRPVLLLFAFQSIYYPGVCGLLRIQPSSWRDLPRQKRRTD